MVGRALIVCLATAACGGSHKAVVTGGERTTEGVGLTVYNDGQGIVKEWRSLDLAAGKNTIRFDDVAALIDATTVHFHSITDPRTSVLEQNYEFDLASAETLLAKSLGQSVTIVSVPKQHGKLEKAVGKPRLVSGTLLSVEAGTIVVKTAQDAQPIVIVERDEDVQSIQLAGRPDGLVTKPALIWMLDAAKRGKQLVKVTYQTTGMGWNADYTVVLAPGRHMGDDTVDLSGWVTLINNSGATYQDAELKLVAGDVHRAPPPASHADTRHYAKAAIAEKDHAEQTGFKEKSFFEYHLYTLGRTTTLPNASVKQIELFPSVANVPAKKILVYFGAAGWSDWGSPATDREYGTTGNKKVDIYLTIKNDKQGGLGIPLPAGRVRLLQMDETDGSLELIGKAQIDHTPKDETIRLQLGSAFDVVGERKQTDYKLDTDAKTLDESFEIRLRNHKTENVEVIVKEVMYRWTNWTIASASAKYDKVDAHTIQAKVAVPANGETVFTYTVHYSW